MNAVALLALEIVCAQLLQACQARAVVVFDATGKEMARAGVSTKLDGPLLVNRLGEGHSAFAPHDDGHVYLALVAPGVVLAVIFDDGPSIGVVALRVWKAADAFTFALKAVPPLRMARLPPRGQPRR